MDMEVLTPELWMDANVRLRLQVMAMVICELGEACGVDVGDCIEKGIVESDVIERVIILFEGKNSDGEVCSYACVTIRIDWKKFELVVETEDEDTIPFEGLDFSNGYCDALDHRLWYFLQRHVSEIKRKYKITNVRACYRYQDKYTRDEETHDAARNYMGHVSSKRARKASDRGFSKSLTTTINGLCDVLNISLEIGD